MTFPEPLASLIEPLTALQRLLDRFSAQGVIIGGIATGFLGKPRFTVDIDAMFLASTKDISRIFYCGETVPQDARVAGETVGIGCNEPGVIAGRENKFLKDLLER